jgi:hypothetical protein
MNTLWLKILYRQRMLAANRGFLAVPLVAAALGVSTDFAVSSALKSCAQPETVVSGVVLALHLSQLFLSIWSGLHAIC